MYFKKLGRYLRVNLLLPGPRLIKKEFTGAAVSQRLRNTELDDLESHTAGCNLGMSHVFIQQLKTYGSNIINCLRESSQSMLLIFLHAS